MRIVFFGSDDFAATNLNALLSSTHTVVGCVTQPDARQGRGMNVALSLIKIIAAEKNIPCLQPESLKLPSVVDALKSWDADLFVVVAYGRLLTKDILNIPKIFCINVHGSLLPLYRGAAPVNWAILNGDKRTGVTIQKMAFALDAGDIIAQATMDIGPHMSADTLRVDMARRGADLLIDTVDAIAVDKYTLTPQNELRISYAPKLVKDMGRIDWNDFDETIYNQIRGLKPWPGTFTMFGDKMLKIIQAMPVEDSHGNPGEVLSIGKEGFVVGCGRGALLVSEVQPQAGKIMSARSFVDGYKLQVGSVFEP